METASLFKNQLNFFDSEPFRPLLEIEIYNAIHKDIPNNHTHFTDEEFGELVAFKCDEQYKDESQEKGQYFIPLALFEGKNGQPTNKNNVNQDVIDYWVFRSSITAHPVMKARYSGLVYELSEKMINKKPDYLIVERYIISILDILDQNLFKVPVYAKYKSYRALKIALLYNNMVLIERTKKTIISLEDKISVNDKAGLWGFSYDFLIKTEKRILSIQEEEKIITNLEERLSLLLTEGFFEAEYAIERLASYYFIKNRSADVERILTEFENMFVSKKNVRAIIQTVHDFEKLYKWYRQFQLNGGAEKILIKLRAYSKESDKEMKSIFSEKDFSKGDMDNYVEFFLKGDSELVFGKIIEKNIPDLEEEKEALTKRSNDFPMNFLFQRTLVDKEGRKLARIGSITEDFEGHLLLQLSQSITANTVILHFILEEGIKREIITSTEIIKYLRNSAVINFDRLYIFEQGINAYFKKDYLTSIHLIVPQIENSIRNLLEINGGNVLIEKNDVYNLKNLDHLLNDEIILKALGENICYYFKVLFSDKRGWNLRNNLAHGLTNSEVFIKQTNDRVIHALLCLGAIRRT